MKPPMNSGEETATAAYRSIADQLAKGMTPETIEANLIDQGFAEETARRLVTEVLDEMPGTLRARYTWQMYSSLGLFGVALLGALGISFLSLLGAPIAFKGVLRTWVAALLWMIGSGYWIVVSLWKIRLTQQLDKARAAWLRGGAPLPVRRRDVSSPSSAPQPEQIVRRSPKTACSGERTPSLDGVAHRRLGPTPIRLFGMRCGARSSHALPIPAAGRRAFALRVRPKEGD
jgi:hypothetical protein